MRLDGDHPLRHIGYSYVIKIVPDMFSDSRYECVTIRSIYEEITRTTKFKTNYPWLGNLRGNIKSLPASISDSAEVKSRLEVITTLNNNGTINPKTGRLFDLSREDRWVIACAATHNYTISSGDNDLLDFAIQQFDIEAVAPLEAINSWLAKKLLIWDEEKQTIMKEWADRHEKSQPPAAKSLFQKMTGFKYSGS